MADIKVSIVLPIYNVEKYLDRCMHSVVSQTYKNIEIIMVDDGSPDCCPKICDDWAKKDARVKVVHKKNEGLGMARNTGIEHASGDYICFFDSDDYIDVTTIEKAVERVKKYDADIVIFGFSNVDTAGNVTPGRIPRAFKECFKETEVRSLILPNLVRRPKTNDITGLYMSAWVSMYSMKLIESTGWRFVSEREIISEDVYSLLSLYEHVNSVAILSEALYFYCENATSLTRVYKEDRFEKINHFYLKTTDLAQRLGYTESVVSAVSFPYIANVFGALKLIINSDKTLKQKLYLFKQILNDTVFVDALSHIDCSNDTLSRRIIIYCMKKKWHKAVYVLLSVRN